MDNKIVSTTYVPLQPPFQIIKYGLDIAMQIGTLIVTIQKEGDPKGLGYEIETHSHPVVSYENKDKVDLNHQLSAYHFLEGAVWNFVEVKDVTTICLSNSILSWQEYIDFLWRDIACIKKLNSYNHTIWILDKLCGGVEPPIAQNYHIKLVKDEISLDGKLTPIIRSRHEDIFALIARVTYEADIRLEIEDQVMVFMHALINRIKDNKVFYIWYETEEEDLKKTVFELNSKRCYTDPIYYSKSYKNRLAELTKKKS